MRAQQQEQQQEQQVGGASFSLRAWRLSYAAAAAHASLQRFALPFYIARNKEPLSHAVLRHLVHRSASRPRCCRGCWISITGVSRNPTRLANRYAVRHARGLPRSCPWSCSCSWSGAASLPAGASAFGPSLPRPAPGVRPHLHTARGARSGRCSDGGGGGRCGARAGQEAAAGGGGCGCDRVGYVWWFALG